MSSKIVILAISSWRGISIGAEHFYGRLSTDDGKRDVRMTHPMTAEEAKANNKKDREMGQTYMIWKKGAMTQGYATRQEVIDQALEEWREFDPKATVLIEGDVGVGDPQNVLEGPAWFIVKANEINDKWPGWEMDGSTSPVCEKLGEQWDKLLERLESKPKRKK